MIITILINVVFVVSLIMFSFYFVTAIKYDITLIDKAYMSLLIGVFPGIVNVSFKNSIANIIVAYVSISENIRKKRAIREAPELKSIWESLIEIENKSFSREFIADMIDIAVYNDNKLQDTVSTLLYKVSRY